MQNTPFPLRLATGHAFCNRVDERKQLTAYINAGHHIWLQAHRRHGKTSLLMQIDADHKANKERIIMHRVDLAFSTNKTDIIQMLCNGTSLLISMIVKQANDLDDESLLTLLLRDFRKRWHNFSPDISLERGMPSVKFSELPSLDVLKKSLLYVDEIAQQYKVRAVFVIDEFQQIGKSHTKDKDYAIEGTVRHCLELSSATSYVFSGSENSLMEQAMTHKERPLFKHTFKISLIRISYFDYQKHIRELYQDKWQVDMPMDVFDDIMDLTQRHPHYVNKLCAILWMTDEIPATCSIQAAWGNIIDNERHEHKKTALSLSPNESVLAKALAINPTDSPTSKAFYKGLDLANGSIIRTIEQLVEKEIIYKNDETYYVINPVLAYLFRYPD
jgi:hypothetical protein